MKKPEPEQPSEESKVRPLRILFVIGSLKTGGTEGQLAMLAGGLSAEGHHVTVFSPLLTLPK